MMKRYFRPVPFAPEASLQDLPQGSRVLLAVTDRVGDALFRTPAIRILVRDYPHIQFDALAFGREAHTVLSQHPDLRNVLLLTQNRAIADLARNYNLIINTRSSNVRRFLSKVQTPIIQHRRIDRNIHKTEDLLRFVQELLPQPQKLTLDDRKYILPVDTKVEESMRHKLYHHCSVKPEQNSLIGLQVGCASVRKHKLFFSTQAIINHKKVWSVHQFARLAQMLMYADPGRKILVLGSPEENFLCQRLVTQVPGVMNTCPDLSLMEMTALINRLDLLICNDSGPMHVACAQQTPVLALCGPTDPQRTGPFPDLPQFEIIKRKSMRKIGVREVWTKAEDILARDLSVRTKVA